MKKLSRLLLPLALMISPVIGSDLEDVLQKHFEAVGGEEKLAAITSIKLKGTVKLRSMEIPFVYAATRGKCRLDISAKGIQITKIFDGRRGWEINAMLGTDEPQPLSKEDTRQLTDFIDGLRGPLAKWKERGYQVTYQGLTAIDKTEHHTIRIQTGSNRVRTLFLNPETYVATAFIEGESDNLKDRNTILSHITVSGITFPKAYRTGESVDCCHSMHKADTECLPYKEIVHQSIEVNPKLDDRLFRVDAPAPSLLAEN